MNPTDKETLLKEALRKRFEQNEILNKIGDIRKHLLLELSNIALEKFIEKAELLQSFIREEEEIEEKHQHNLYLEYQRSESESPGVEAALRLGEEREKKYILQCKPTFEFKELFRLLLEAAAKLNIKLEDLFNHLALDVSNNGIMLKGLSAQGDQAVMQIIEKLQVMFMIEKSKQQTETSQLTAQQAAAQRARSSTQPSAPPASSPTPTRQGAAQSPGSTQPSAPPAPSPTPSGQAAAQRARSTQPSPKPTGQAEDKAAEQQGWPPKPFKNKLTRE